MIGQSTVERLLYVTLALIFLGVGIACYVLFAQLQNQQKVTQEIKTAVAELKADKAARDKIILDHTDCIAFFLSQPNRAQVRISDIQNCQLAPTDTDTPAMQNPATTKAQSASPTPTPSASPAPNATPPNSSSIPQRIIDFIRGLTRGRNR